VLSLGLVVTRRPFEDLIASLARPTSLRWPGAETLLAVGLPTALGTGLRLVFLGQPMRYDEALTFNEFASRPLYYGLSFYPDPNNHLLNTLLMHVAYVALGNQTWVLRLPAFVAGVLLIPATYALTRLLFGTPGAAFLSATLVAVSSYLVEYSSNARGYTMQALCFVALLALVIEAVREDSPRALLLGAFVAALGAFAVPTMLYGVAVAAAWLVVEMRRRRPRHIGLAHVGASGLLAGECALLLYLPAVLVSGPDKLVANRFVVPLGAADLLQQLPRSLVQTWSLWNRDVPLLLIVLLVAGFALGTRADVSRGRMPIGVVAPAICVLLVMLQRVAPFERVWLFLLPLYFAIAGAGLARLVDGRLLGLAFGAILCFTTLTSGSILRSTETGSFPDAEAVARTLSGRLGGQDAVVTQLPASLPELQYYFPRFALSTDPLVRPPEQAARLYVISPPGAEPHFDGWGEPMRVGIYAQSALYALDR
jgi:hypothetical protein